MLTRFWFFMGCAVVALISWGVSDAIRHPLKAEMWLVAASVLVVMAVAERLER